MNDLVIRGGRLVDGTGAAARSADVAISNGIITEVGRITSQAKQEIDADGALIAPGFVDIHTHYDGQATWDSRIQPSAWHGVTTVVFGNCGVGFAPVHPEHHDRLVELMEGVEDIPGTALHEGLSWKWRSFADYLDALDALPHDLDIAAQVPHSALRLHVMGERGAQREPATAEEVAAMAAITRDGIRAGALGFATSRTLNHRSSKGEPIPTLTASTDELVGIACGVAEAGHGVVQIVSDFADFDNELDLYRAIVRTSGRPLSLSLAQAKPGNSYRRILDFASAMSTEGFAVRTQVGARAVGLIMGLRCTLHPFLTNRVYRTVADLEHNERLRALRDPAMKARVLEAQVPTAGRIIDRFELMFELEPVPNYEPSADMSIAARAAQANVDVVEFVYDLLVGGDGETLLYSPTLNYADGNLDAVHDMLTHECSLPGLSDGGAHVGSICDGSFPTTLLSWWGRDRPTDRLPLEFIIQRQSRDTARWMGLNDRGVIAPGYRADVNVIDHDGLTLHRPEMHYDLPAGGKRLLQRASGYMHTYVAGVETYRDGVETGALPGRLIRGPQPAPPALRR